MLALREEMRATLADQPRALKLVDALFENPYIDANRVKKLLDISDPTARKTLGVLEGVGLINETTGRSWGRQYLARGVLAAIEDPGEIEEGP